MYRQSHFKEDRVEVMHELMRAQPLATLVTYAADGITANHIPMALDSEASAHGVLRGHVAKGNSFWKNFDPSVDALAVFQGPQHYITPSWYPSKKEHGKAVPTWNYVVVHAYGPMTIVDDPDWLLAHLQTLTSEHEDGREEPWAVGDAPDDFVARMIKGMVGIEVPISRLEGMWKTSQNRPEQDRLGVVGGLNREGTPSAAQMAGLVAV